MIVLDVQMKEQLSGAFDTLVADEAERVRLMVFLEARLADSRDQRLFLALRYLLVIRNDTQFAQHLFEVVHTLYRTLAKHYREAAPNQFLDQLFMDFYQETHVVKCIESRKSQERAQTAQRVLRHLSMHQERVLHTHQLMIANVSHEMRTSLAVIEGYGNIVLDEDMSPKDTKEYLTKIQTATKTLTSLVGDILSITKLNSGQLEIENKPFWIDEMMIESIDSILQKSKKKGLEFSYAMPLLSSQFYGDGHRIFEIITNLLTNAVKYTQEGTVSLMLKREVLDATSVKFNFEVKDSGIGLSLEEQRSIFDSYVRHNSTEEGLGLGLYISRQLAQRMGGALTVKSKQGEGSTFCFSVTLQRYPLEKHALQGLRLCFLEEYQSEKSQKMLEERVRLLESLGAEVTRFYKGEVFSNELFSSRNVVESHPDMISVITERDEHYKGYDELIGYVKHFGRYKGTTFISEGTQERSLENFDRVFSQQAPLSYYLNLCKEKRKKISTTTNSDTMRILIVDDMATNLELLRLFVKKRYPNIVVDTVLNANEAVAYYEQEVYDLILLDLRMPEVDGFMLYENLKAIKPLPPTYALTADAYSQTRERVEETGFDGMLIKPLAVEKLYQIIEEQCDA